MTDSAICLFAGELGASVRLMAAMPNVSDLDPVHAGGGAPEGEIAAVTACGTGDAWVSAAAASAASM